MLRRTTSAVLSIVVLGACVGSIASAAGSSTDSASQRVALAVNSKNNGFSGSIQCVLANAFDGALK